MSCSGPLPLTALLDRAFSFAEERETKAKLKKQKEEEEAKLKAATLEVRGPERAQGESYC